MSENPYDPPQSLLDHEQERKPRLAPAKDSWPKLLLLKLGLCCVLFLGEIYLAIIFLDQGLVAWGLYGSSVIPGGDHFKPQHLVYGLLFNGFVLHGVWRSMD